MSVTPHVYDVLVALLAVGAYFYVRRHGGGIALDQLQRANDVLGRRVTELERENSRQAAELVRLRAETNVALAVAPVLVALEKHETRASARSEKTLHVLQLIADRLGPEAHD